MTFLKKHIVLIVLLAIGLGIIIGVVSNASTYSDFDEALQNPGEEFHIIGKFNNEKSAEVVVTSDARYFVFYMFDKNNKENVVVFNGEKPQDFEKSEQVVIIGGMKDSTFMATDLLLKCPSKYDKKGFDTEEKFQSKNKSSNQ